MTRESGSTFMMNIDKDLKLELLIHCKRKGTTLADLIRDYLKEYAKKEGLINDEAHV